MNTVFQRTPVLKDCPTHYCPGCGHGIAHRLLAEVVDELNIQDRTIGIAPVGCAVLAYNYLDVDMIEVAHGRAPAVATGMKRTNPDKIIFSYQGDGDLAAIGTAEIIHAAHRAERITVIFINNAVFGMTGGQMAPTTMLGQITATTQQGRNPSNGQGYPLQVSEILALLPGTVYVERCALSGVPGIKRTKAAMKHAFGLQMDDAPGLSLVEILSPCPTYWRMSPAKAMKWIEEEMCKAFPIARLKG
ncbi:MAG: thiamine pyrophosphate-dependent enzyme [Sedimentisphaerales bacterium]|jgi:2-oxoglutarate ferredoxin oxidoreductase subunit beta|nr:thiamine pyrophosphate-dependent enzyme [Sedimentisphaerales bacterium]HNY79752.1 thiamine pyrophosphate-dependent enzyme [Sedimentisphaerales bacterium]HOC64741.1 thiamine pyrophosphate-dependent enzyme [Sedimentisphaerales bacterium]HOH65741.1 thiamine pyrophosphate-dependent enzyme [Sedimentisphaerales bacterium]HPY51211.1 thiamine pyrophosphate-dependent enzyme [Sedimentisphaerales bacterium]